MKILMLLFIFFNIGFVKATDQKFNREFIDKYKVTYDWLLRDMSGDFEDVYGTATQTIVGYDEVNDELSLNWEVVYANRYGRIQRKGYLAQIQPYSKKVVNHFTAPGNNCLYDDGEQLRKITVTFGNGQKVSACSQDYSEYEFEAFGKTPSGIIAFSVENQDNPLSNNSVEYFTLRRNPPDWDGKPLF